jgi:DNA-binding NarL/FixJ family response regulator
MASGHGTPLVFLPNAWSHIQLFWRTPWRRSLFEALAQHFRLIQYDARGQGLSGRGLGPTHTADDYVRDIDAVIERLQLDRFVLLARNLFCQVAIRYALHDQGRVRALILGNPVKDLYEDLDDLRSRRWELYTETIARLSNLPADAGEIASQFREAITQEDHIKLVTALRWPSQSFDLGRLEPPTLVIDSSTSPLHAHEWAAQLTAAIPQARLVTEQDRAGSSGFFSAGGEAPGIVEIIKQFTDQLTADSLDQTAAVAGGLSQREVEVLRLIAAGRSNQQIAEALVISVNTVQRHVSNIFAKTGSGNRTEAAGFARDHGIV